ncbi:MAG: Fic family protein [Chlorobium sp.]|nr:Fic family protein [Chlorobium sp.]
MNFPHDGAPSVIELAAYAYGIIRNHPFIDDTKRTGFLAHCAMVCTRVLWLDCVTSRASYGSHCG